MYKTIKRKKNHLLDCTYLHKNNAQILFEKKNKRVLEPLCCVAR